MSEKDPFELEQVSVRLVSAPPLYSTETVNSPEAAIRIMANELKDYDREVACVINLKTDYEPINFSICSMGALDQALIHPREMMKNMFLSNANSVIVVHNHPSGNLTPSKQDIAMTDRLAQLCSLAGIGLLDHIIIGGGNDKSYYSMKENDQISVNKVRFATEIDEIQWPDAVAAEEKQDYPKKQPQNKMEEKAETVSEKRPSVLAELNEKKQEIKARDDKGDDMILAEADIKTLSLADYLNAKGIDQIEDDQEFMETEFESVRDWCDAHDYDMTPQDKAEIDRRGLTEAVEDLRDEKDESKNEIDQGKNEKNENEKDEAENKKEADEKPLTADEVMDIKCISSEYSPHLKTATHLLNCEIRGVPDVLTYKVTQHDYGDGFTLHSQKDDIWNTMERKEMLQLEDIVSAEVTFHELSESIDKAETMKELRDIRFDIVEGDDLNLSEEQITKLYDKMDERETELIEATLPPKDEKQSVLEKLNEKKDEARSTEIPKTKSHTEIESR